MRKYLTSSLALSLGVFSTAAAFPQDEASLKHHLEGREVVLRIDAPGHKSGVDIRPQERNPLSYSRLGDRLRRYGVSIPKGATALVTQVKVKKKNIEFHLNGGGFAGDYSAPSLVSTSVSKSNREKRLEEELELESSLTRRREIEEELEDLREARDREEERLKLEKELNSRLAEAVEFGLRRQGGTRFNLWYEPRVPPEALTPEAVMQALSPYLDFAPPSRTPADSKADLFPLRKGMTEDEVEALLGVPHHRSERREADLILSESTYSLGESELNLQFARGILVRYLLQSK